MAKGKKRTELEKLVAALASVNLCEISTEEFDAAVAEARKKAQKAEIEKQIAELKKKLEEL